jgi:hypothetical protein
MPSVNHSASSRVSGRGNRSSKATGGKGGAATAAPHTSRKQQRRLNQPGGRGKANRRHLPSDAEGVVTHPALPVDDDEAEETTVAPQQLPSVDAWARKMHAMASEEA